MVDKLKTKLRTPHSRKRIRIEVDVRESNLDALHFFFANSFLVTEIIKDMYDLTDDDCFRMEYYS